MKRIASLTLLASSVLVAACSSTDPMSKLDYKSDRAAPKSSLEVPPDLTAPQVQNRYATPGSGAASLSAYQQSQGDGKAKPSQAAPVDGAVLAKVQDVRMARDGNQRWLAVGKQSPQELWPVLKAFWQDNGFVVKTEEPEIGVMETDWAENRAKLPNDGVRKLMETVGLGAVYSTPERDKFRIRLEKTTEGTEVYFSHRGMYEIYTNEARSDTKWQPRPTDPELEAAFLGRFMVRLGIQNEKAKQAVETVTAPAASGDVRAKLDGNKLVVGDSFDRAWRRIGLALDRVGLVVSDRDRSQGTYFVHPAQSEAEAKAEGGFWSSLAFWKDKKPQAGGKVDNDYRVVVKPASDTQSVLMITDSRGAALPDAETRTLLGKLRNELQ
ncbi:outer membrane protein assembly factor BamC [Crenobacter cavernae]|uniref:Outer membrane protein assembly factor BamC n=1 Tax=Crenobacter cavernae TaxID=2290923 RepID=A0A345Y6J1_9NEIS|nr:outer membrane protein assembly factor BamC [Crenobacter cavernae]AXK39543.1 outer membrane protein assembly factor BamC [Crenobacter cavernae]